MKTSLYRMILLTAIAGVIFLQPAPVLAQDIVVTFPDPNLEAAIREAIGKPSGEIYDTDLESISSEMADILAWLCSLANIIGIDLEKALLTKYPLKCSKCGQNPCICTES